MRDWKNFLNLTPRSQGIQNVWYRNGKFIGEVIQDVDGYWKFGFPMSQNHAGLWEASDFQMLADMLTELNMEWDAEIKAYFENEGENHGHG